MDQRAEKPATPGRACAWTHTERCGRAVRSRLPGGCKHDVVSVMIRTARLEQDRDALLAVQRAGYAVEAELIGVESLPPQHHPVDQLRAESIWVAEDDHGEITGVLGLEHGPELLIARLVVRPDRMQRGIGRALGEHALALAAGCPVRVGTAAANIPALTLYRALGFEPVVHKTVGDGVPYIELRHPGEA
jgi:GNAT superfamily N-acetyltransferase